MAKKNAVSQEQSNKKKLIIKAKPHLSGFYAVNPLLIQNQAKGITGIIRTPGEGSNNNLVDKVS